MTLSFCKRRRVFTCAAWQKVVPEVRIAVRRGEARIYDGWHRLRRTRAQGCRAQSNFLGCEYTTGWNTAEGFPRCSHALRRRWHIVARVIHVWHLAIIVTSVLKYASHCTTLAVEYTANCGTHFCNVDFRGANIKCEKQRPANAPRVPPFRYSVLIKSVTP